MELYDGRHSNYLVPSSRLILPVPAVFYRRNEYLGKFKRLTSITILEVEDWCLANLLVFLSDSMGGCRKKVALFKTEVGKLTKINNKYKLMSHKTYK